MDINTQFSKISLQDDDSALDELAEDVFRLTIQEREVTQKTSAPNVAPPASASGARAALEQHAAQVFNQLAGAHYQRLVRWDERIDTRCKEVLLRLDSLASPSSTIDQEVLLSLEEEDRWLKGTLEKVIGLIVTSESVKIFQNTLVERLESLIEAVDCYKLILSNRASNSIQDDARIYDSGK